MDTLRKILKPNKNVFGYELVQAALAAMDALNIVVEKSFGQLLDPTYFTAITDFAQQYVLIAIKTKNDVDGLSFNCSLKAHVLFSHIPMFLQTQNEAKRSVDPNWVDRALGYFSEQASGK